jgi:hypothetical protein
MRTKQQGVCLVRHFDNLDFMIGTLYRENVVFRLWKNKMTVDETYVQVQRLSIC